MPRYTPVLLNREPGQIYTWMVLDTHFHYYIENLGAYIPTCMEPSYHMQGAQINTWILSRYTPGGCLDTHLEGAQIRTWRKQFVVWPRPVGRIFDLSMALITVLLPLEVLGGGEQGQSRDEVGFREGLKEVQRRVKVWVQQG